MESFISFIALWPLDWAPRGWSLCWGAILSISENTALFSLLGSTYGGDGRTNFGLPDFRGRLPLGYGYGVGLSPYPVLGMRGGSEMIVLTQDKLPAHTHGATFGGGNIEFKASSDPGTENTPGTNNAKTLAASMSGFQVGDKLYNTATPEVSLEGASIKGSGITVNTTGSNKAHENRQPYLVTNYIMCMVGLYPTRT